MMMRVSVTSLVLILSCIFCSPSWAQRPNTTGSFITNLESVVVAEGENVILSCQSDTPVNWQRRLFSASRPINSERICYNGEIMEGYEDEFSINVDHTEQPPKYTLIILNADINDSGEYTCIGNAGLGDSVSAYLIVYANPDCASGEVKCEGESPTRQCISNHWFCDGDNDCGNNWDEDPAVCADVTCQSGFYECPEGATGRPCVPESFLCDGDNDCGDSSDEDPSVCRANGYFTSVRCMRSIYRHCLVPTGFVGMSVPQIYQKLADTDLRELCGPLLIAQECVTEALVCPVCHMSDPDHPTVIELQQTIEAVNITVNHVCRDNIEVFDEHKECLLRLGGHAPAIIESLEEQCPDDEAEPLCLPTELMDCGEGVVSQQCGQEIAGQLRTLGTKVMTALGCETQKRFEMKKKQMRMQSVFTGKKLMKKKTYSPLELMQKAFPTLF